jgi:Na+/proline symporter
MNTWIEHLNSPLVLIAFMLFVVAGVIKFMLKTNIIKVTQANSAKLLNKSLNYVFMLALIGMVFGFFSQPEVLNVVKNPPINNNPKSSSNTLNNSTITNSTVNQAGGDINTTTEGK